MAVRDSWDLAGRDVIPDLGVRGAPKDVGAALLYALLKSENATWTPPYNEVRKNLGIRLKTVAPELQEQADQRVRTWKKLFEGLGLMYDAEGLLHVTHLGRRLRDELESMYEKVDEVALEISSGARWRLARIGAVLVSRYQLRNPSTEDDYPADTDIFPLWAILHAMRRLDGKLHWEEVGRVLTKCLRMEDLAGAEEEIRAAREAHGYDPNDLESAETFLGARSPDLGDDQQDRIIVWLSRAGFKDILIEHRNRPDGYRYLNEEFVSIVDELLARSPTQQVFESQGEYVEWLGSPPPAAETSTELLEMIVERCHTHGDRFFIALVGVAGTGKTRFAEAAARRITDGDKSRWESVQFHAAFTYEEFIGGLVPNDAGGFERAPGLLLRLNERALKSDLPHVLVIDELSRADVANVLGELLTYVEYRERPFMVAALGEEVQLAPNLIIIVTLNPTDRSVLNLDDAVVRRLRQIPVPKDAFALRAILDAAGMAPTLREQVLAWFLAIPADTPFGHGMFVGVATEQDLYQLWHEQLAFFLRRGDMITYANPSAIEAGFVWKDKKFAGGTIGATAAVGDDSNVSETTDAALSASEDGESAGSE